MTNKDLLVAFGGIDADLILEAAPSAKFTKEKSDSTQPRARDNRNIVSGLAKLGALAAAIVLLLFAIPMLLNRIPNDEIVINEYNDVIENCDVAILGTYKGKKQNLTYAEYYFEVTEVLKGEVTEKKITVRSEKETIFSDDDMEAYAKSVNAAFEYGKEYYLTLQSECEIITFISEQIVAINDLENLHSATGDLAKFLEDHGITIKTTREELIEFFSYIFGTTEPENTMGTEGLIYELDYYQGDEKNVYTVTGYIGSSSYVIIPAEYNGLPVKYIGSSAFKDNGIIRSVHLPDSIKWIFDNAFYDCLNLTSINIPKDVTTIDWCTFYNCRKLTVVDIQGDLQYIVTYAFKSCANLKSIDLPESLLIIDDEAFAYCKSLEKIHIPANTKIIGKEAFVACENLSNITVDENNPVYHSSQNCIIETETKTLILGCKNSVIPSDGSVTSIGYVAFHGMRYLEEIVIPSSVKRIEMSAFLGCSSLKKVTLSEGLEAIGESAFADTGIIKIDIPNSVTSISNYAFDGCKLQYNVYKGGCYLGNESNPYIVLMRPESTLSTTIEVAPTTKIIYCYAFYQTKLTEIYLPEGVTSIGTYAFSTSTLQKISIPKSITFVDTFAFKDCSISILYTLHEGAYYLGNERNPYLIFMRPHNIFYIKEVIIPEQTKLISSVAFEGCQMLSKVYIPGSIETIPYHLFSGIQTLTEVTISPGVKYIEGYAFRGCTKLNTIVYLGTKEDWNAIEKELRWHSYDLVVKCTDGEVVHSVSTE